MPMVAVPAWLQKAQSILREESESPPPLAALAARVGVHPVHLAQEFRRKLGTTTKALVRQHRVFDAVERIGAGSTLADAACAAGFADQSHMTRVFRQLRGTTPGDPNFVQYASLATLV